MALKSFLRFESPFFCLTGKRKAGILIVNGGDGPAAGHWLHIYLNKYRVTHGNIRL
jgi:hypothetical protein